VTTFLTLLTFLTLSTFRDNLCNSLDTPCKPFSLSRHSMTALVTFSILSDKSLCHSLLGLPRLRQARLITMWISHEHKSIHLASRDSLALHQAMRQADAKLAGRCLLCLRQDCASVLASLDPLDARLQLRNPNPCANQPRQSCQLAHGPQKVEDTLQHKQTHSNTSTGLTTNKHKQTHTTTQTHTKTQTHSTAQTHYNTNTLQHKYTLQEKHTLQH
jgi:hypothetical protein